MLLSGWMTDRVLADAACGRAVFFMAHGRRVHVAVLEGGRINPGSLNTSFLCATGFFIYGPQALVGIAAANLATKRAAASAVGLTGLFGYASTLLSGWGLGRLVETRGWETCFAALLTVTVIGALLFLLGWRAKAHGYGNA